MDARLFRWFALAAFAGGLSISTVYRRRARLQETIARGREAPLLVAGRVGW